MLRHGANCCVCIRLVALFNPKRNGRAQQQSVSTKFAITVGWILFDDYSQRRGPNAHLEIRLRRRWHLQKILGTGGRRRSRQNLLITASRLVTRRPRRPNRIESILRRPGGNKAPLLPVLGQLGVALPVNGFLDTLTANGGIDRSVTARDNVSLFATSTRTSYEPSSGGTPFTDTVARGSWRHNFSSITTGSVSSEFELLNYDNASNSRIQIYRNQVGVDATLSPLLSFRGNIGAINLITEGGVNPLAATSVNSLGASTSSSLMALDWRRGSDLQNAEEHHAYADRESVDRSRALWAHCSNQIRLAQA